MIRLFVAVYPPPDIRARLAGLCAGITDARWVSPENMHLTLRFIGEVEEPRLEDIGYELRGIRAASFPLTLAGVGHFENRGRVRAIWAGVQPSPELVELQHRVDAAIRRAGLGTEGRRFSPHVTLARLKNAKPDAVGRWLQANGAFRGFPFDVSEFTLFASHQGKEAAVYQPLEDYPLRDL